MSIFKALIIALLPLYLFATPIAIVKSVAGDEAYLISGENSAKIVQNTQITDKNSIIETKASSRVVLHWHDGSVIVVGASSRLVIKDEIDITQESGEAYYKTKLLKPLSNIRSSSFKISSRTATIGVRGTEFIINESDSTGVKLKEGKLEILSIKEEFLVYKQKQMSEFEAYKKRLEKEFDQWKTGDYEYSHKSAKIELNKNKTVKIDGDKLYEADITDNDLESFANYREFLKESL